MNSWQNAKESAHAATQRAACASSEVAQLRVELERMTQAYRKEQTKCTATVNKLTEVSCFFFSFILLLI